MTYDASGVAYDTTDSNTTYLGLKIAANVDGNFESITKDGSCNATTGQLCDATKAVLASGSFSGNVATLSGTLTMTNGTTYYLFAGSGGASYSYRLKTNNTYPITGTNVNFTGVGAASGNPPATDAYNIAGVTSSQVVDYTATPATLTMTLTLQASEDVVFSLPSALALTTTATTDIVIIDALPLTMASTLTAPAASGIIYSEPAALTLTTTLQSSSMVVFNLPAALTLTTAATDELIIIEALPLTMASTLTIAIEHIITANPLGTISVGTGGIGTRYINKDYPNTIGLTAGTTKSQTEPSLVEDKW